MAYKSYFSQSFFKTPRKKSYFSGGLSSVLSKKSSGDKLASVEKEIASLERKLGKIAQTDDRNALEKLLNTPKNTGFIGDVIDILNRPLYAVTGFISGGPKGVWEGLTGKRRITSGELLEKAGLPKGVSSVLGFVGDIVLDPTTYLTLGGGGVAKAVIKEGLEAGLKGVAKEAAEKAVQDIAKEGVEKLAKEVGEEGLEKATKSLLPAKIEYKEVPFHISFMGKKLFDLPKPAQSFIKTTEETLRSIPFVKRTAEVFSPLSQMARPIGMEKTEWQRFVDMARQYMDDVEYAKEKALEKVVELTKDVPIEARKEIFHFLDTTKIPKSGDVSVLIPERLQPYKDTIQGIVNMFREGAAKEQALGSLKQTREAYAPRIRIDKFPGIKAYKERKLEGSVADIHKQLGKEIFETDIAKAAAVREVTRARDITTREFINKVLDTFGRKLKEGEGVKEGEVLFIPRKGIPWTGEPVALPKEINAVVENFYKTFINDESTRAFLRYFDEVQNLWKRYATFANPGFSFRNMFSNIFQNWLAGLKDPTKYALALDIVREGPTAKTVKLGGKEYTYEKLIDLAKKHGVFGKGRISADIPKEVTERLGEMMPIYTDKERILKAVNPLSKENVLVKFGRKLNEAVENNARLALFLDRLAKGDTPEQAGLTVKKFLFDYAELTPFERNVLRRVMPFYTWVRKNVPLQLEMMVRQPGKYAAIGKAKAEIERMSEGEHPDEAFIPDYVKELYGIRLPMSNKQMAYYLNPNLPFQDIEKLNPAALYSNIFSMLSPFIRVPTELAFNKNLYLNIPIERYPGQLKPAPPLYQIPGLSQLLGVREVKGQPMMPATRRYLIETVPFIKNVAAFTEKKGGEKKAHALSWLGGVKIIPYSAEKAKINAAYKRLQELRDLYAKAIDEGLIPPPERRKKK